MSANLLPCPLCGHAAQVTTDAMSGRSHLFYGVECANFGECEAELTGFASEEAAVAQWNGRYNNIIPTAKAGGFPKGSGK